MHLSYYLTKVFHFAEEPTGQICPSCHVKSIEKTFKLLVIIFIDEIIIFVTSICIWIEVEIGCEKIVFGFLNYQNETLRYSSMCKMLIGNIQ